MPEENPYGGGEFREGQPVPDEQVARRLSWQVMVVSAVNPNELLEAINTPFFQENARQILDTLAIGQIQNMNSANIEGLQFVVMVVELPDTPDGQVRPLSPEEAMPFCRLIAHQLIDGHVGGNINIVDPPQANETIPTEGFTFSGWSVPQDE